jgi:hypothetical protein
MKDGPSGIKIGHAHQALPDGESDDQAGRQSSGAIQATSIGPSKPCSLDWCRCRSEITAAPSSPRPGCQDSRTSRKRRPVLTPRRHQERLTADWVGSLGRFDVRCRHLNLHWTFAVRRGGSLDRDPPERRLRAVAPRRAEDRRREDLTDVFRLAWEHGVNGQAQVIKGMQQILASYSLLQDKEAMGEVVANVRWLIAAGIRDFQAMLDELGKLQTGLARDAPAPDEPTHDD